MNRKQTAPRVSPLATTVIDEEENIAIANDNNAMRALDAGEILQVAGGPHARGFNKDEDGG